MIQHHVDVYHCQRCGRVSSCDHKASAPECCRETMSLAVADVDYDHGQRETTAPESAARSTARHRPPKKG